MLRQGLKSRNSLFVRDYYRYGTEIVYAMLAPITTRQKMERTSYELTTTGQDVSGSLNASEKQCLKNT